MEQVGQSQTTAFTLDTCSVYSILPLLSLSLFLSLFPSLSLSSSFLFLTLSPSLPPSLSFSSHSFCHSLFLALHFDPSLSHSPLRRSRAPVCDRSPPFTGDHSSAILTLPADRGEGTCAPTQNILSLVSLLTGFQKPLTSPNLTIFCIHLIPYSGEFLQTQIFRKSFAFLSYRNFFDFYFCQLATNSY